jgi:glutaredoxin
MTEWLPRKRIFSNLRTEMLKVIFILCLVVGCVKLCSYSHAKNARLEPLLKQPYIVIYGRETCGNCAHLKRELSMKGISFVSKDIDNDSVAAEAHRRMKVRGMETSSYTLPVVDVNTQISTNPSVEWVTASYRKLAPQK